LNMNSKTDKKSGSCDDIAFLSEIITNSKYWQICSRNSDKLGAAFRAYHNFKRSPDTLYLQLIIIYFDNNGIIDHGTVSQGV